MAIEDSLINPERFSDMGQGMVEKLFFGLDGRASQRAGNAIVEFVEEKS